MRIAEERAQLTEKLKFNTWEIIELLRDPRHTLMPLDQLAHLLGVSRQSLYRWREIGQQLPPDLPVAVSLSQRDEDGNYIYNFG